MTEQDKEIASLKGLIELQERQIELLSKKVMRLEKQCGAPKEFLKLAYERYGENPETD